MYIQYSGSTGKFPFSFSSVSTFVLCFSLVVCWNFPSKWLDFYKVLIHRCWPMVAFPRFTQWWQWRFGKVLLTPAGSAAHMEVVSAYYQLHKWVRHFLGPSAHAAGFYNSQRGFSVYDGYYVLVVKKRNKQEGHLDTDVTLVLLRCQLFSIFFLLCCCCLVAIRILGDPMGYSLPGSSVHGISKARTLE